MIVAYVSTKGDPSVGIYGESAEVTFSYEFDEHDCNDREHVRDELQKCFSTIWNEKAYVIFEDETLYNEPEDL